MTLLQEEKNQAQKSIANPSYRICNRCVMDTNVPGISFSKSGECNFCALHDKLDRAFPLNEESEKRFDRIVEEMKRRGKNQKYDCVMGISGGRDSIYSLYLAVKVFGLRPLVVHFNDGFGNPIAGENMMKATRKLQVDLRTVTSDWRESKDLKIAYLKASTPDLEEATDVGIATALYGMAVRENVKYLLIGQSFRTEGIAPLSWNYLDGKYLKAVHKQFGTVPLRPWKPEDPGFNLDVFQMFYYTVWKGIRTIPLLYYLPYVRSDAEQIIKREFDWVYPGAHYFDDLYQALMTYVLRVKFKIDRRIFNYSALVRSKQMGREEALQRMREVYVIEDPKIIDLCIKRLGITREQFDGFLSLPPKTFYDYPNHYSLIRKLRIPIWVLSKLNLLPGTAYDKYFHCGK